MKTLFSKKKQEQFLDTNWTVKVLRFKWGKSGTHKCTLLDKRDNKLGSAGGYGYDKKGTALGEFLQSYFMNELKKLNSNKFYGLSHYNKVSNKFQAFPSKNTKTYVDGACGFESMTRILNKIGFNLVFIKESKWEILYTLEPLPKNHYSRR